MDLEEILTFDEAGVIGPSDRVPGPQFGSPPRPEVAVVAMDPSEKSHSPNTGFSDSREPVSDAKPRRLRIGKPGQNFFCTYICTKHFFCTYICTIWARSFSLYMVADHVVASSPDGFSGWHSLIFSARVAELLRCRPSSMSCVYPPSYRSCACLFMRISCHR